MKEQTKENIHTFLVAFFLLIGIILVLATLVILVGYIWFPLSLLWLKIWLTSLIIYMPLVLILSNINY